MDSVDNPSSLTDAAHPGRCERYGACIFSRHEASSITAPGPFSRFAGGVAHAAGSAPAFALAVLVIAGWAVTGPMFHYSDTWQLAVNTTTTIVTFLMVFLIQHTQNRDGIAIQMKLDELIRANLGAQNVLLDLEERGDGELAKLRKQYLELARKARHDH
jgi:low affinity Fe/Cu permease